MDSITIFQAACLAKSNGLYAVFNTQNNIVEFIGSRGKACKFMLDIGCKFPHGNQLDREGRSVFIKPLDLVMFEMAEKSGGNES